MLPTQSSGTALYEPGSQISPSEQLLNNPYNLSNQSLLGGSASSRQFNLQTDGSYQAGEKDKGTLTLVGNVYQLKEQDGTVIVFRTDGQLSYLQDTNGYRLSATYAYAKLTKLSDSTGEFFNLTYNTQGRINKITDSSGQATNYTYDPSGQNLLSIQDTRGTTQFTYGSPFDLSLVTSVTSADGTKTFYDYDQVGRIQQVIQGEGRQALAYTYTYDDLGGYTLKDPSGAITTVTYDEATKTRTIADPLGRVFQYTYDAAGMLDTVTAPDGSKIDYNFCGCGSLRSLIDPLGNTTTFDYETTFGKISQLKDARGNDILYGYDTKGNLASITYEDSTHQDYSYNAKGQLTQSVNRRGQSINYEYNNNYQITKETHSDGRIISYEYGATNGLLTYVRNNSGESNTSYTQFTYNQAANKFSSHNANGIISTYSFDKLGRKTQIFIRDAANTYTTNYSYDAFGRLDKLTNGSGNLIIDYIYDAVGRLTKEVNGNGTYSVYTYDAASQITSLINYTASNTINSRFDYTYDNLGRRTSMTTLEGKWDYTYDKIGQVTRAVFTSSNTSVSPNQDLTYVYDAAGNRTQTIENGVTGNYTANNLNQYTQSGTTTNTYDADGNLITKKLGTLTRTYSYDDQNRLIQVIDGVNNKTQYEYDVFGNRSATIYNGVRTDYLVDPFGMGNVVAEYNNTSNVN